MRRELTAGLFVVLLFVLEYGVLSGGEITTEGMLFYAPLDDSADANSAIGAKGPKTNKETRLVEGKFGQGVELKGEARLYYSGIDNFNLSEGTVAFWAKRYKSWSQKESGYILFKAVAGPGWNRNSLYFQTTQWGQLRVWIWDNDSKQTLYMVRPLPPAADEWYHLAFTFSDGEVRIYVNGQEGSYTDDGKGDPMMVMPSGKVETIQFGSDYNHSFDGVLDELRIYNRVLSPENIKALYEHVPRK